MQPISPLRKQAEKKSPPAPQSTIDPIQSCACQDEESSHDQPPSQLQANPGYARWYSSLNSIQMMADQYVHQLAERSAFSEGVSQLGKKKEKKKGNKKEKEAKKQKEKATENAMNKAKENNRKAKKKNKDDKKKNKQDKNQAQKEKKLGFALPDVKLKEQDLDKVLVEIDQLFVDNLQALCEAGENTVQTYFNRMYDHLATAEDLHYNIILQPEFIKLKVKIQKQLQEVQQINKLGKNKKGKGGGNAPASDLVTTQEERWAYKADILQPKVWGGVPEASAIADHYNIKLTVYVLDQQRKIRLLNPNVGSGRPSHAHLLFVNNNHFMTVTNVVVGQKLEQSNGSKIDNPAGGDCLYYAMAHVLRLNGIPISNAVPVGGALGPLEEERAKAEKKKVKGKEAVQALKQQVKGKKDDHKKDFMEKKEEKEDKGKGSKDGEERKKEYNQMMNLRRVAHTHISDDLLNTSVLALKAFGDQRDLGANLKALFAISNIKGVDKEKKKKMDDLGNQMVHKIKKLIAAEANPMKKAKIDKINSFKDAKELSKLIEEHKAAKETGMHKIGKKKVKNTRGVLRAMARILRSYCKINHPETQEVQLMLAYDKIFISANQRVATNAIKAGLGKTQKGQSLKSMLHNWRTMYNEGKKKKGGDEEVQVKNEDYQTVAAWLTQYSEALRTKEGLKVEEVSSEALNLEINEVSFVIVPGRSQVPHEMVHAEQTLLAFLTQRLKQGIIPEEVHVAGTKKPCSVCLDVLRADYDALKDVYPMISFSYLAEKGCNNKDKKEVKKLKDTSIRLDRIKKVNGNKENKESQERANKFNDYLDKFKKNQEKDYPDDFEEIERKKRKKKEEEKSKSKKKDDKDSKSKSKGKKKKKKSKNKDKNKKAKQDDVQIESKEEHDDEYHENTNMLNDLPYDEDDTADIE